jgi:hypothetical protein
VTTHLEDELAVGMHDKIADVTFTRDILAEAMRRHRRRIVLHRTAYAVGTFGVIGALAVTLTVRAGETPDRGGATGPVAERPTTPADTPQLRLAAAAAASQNISYRVKVTITLKNALPPKDGLPEPVSSSWMTAGAFDPASATGYLDSPYTGLRPAIDAGFEHERLIDGVRYVGGRDGAAPDNGEIVWSRYPGTQDHLDFDLALNGGLTVTSDPQELFRVLRDAGANVTETVPGTYHFTVTVTNDRLIDHLVGEVKLGADNRIATVTYDREAKETVKSEAFTYRLHAAIELSGYGAPVDVQAPAAFLTQG